MPRIKNEAYLTNIQKVALEANVSVATVSRVINNSPKVTPETRQKVEEAIASLKYVPNMLARNLRTSESRSILVMVTNISNLFYLETIRGISDVAYENGYDLLLSETNENLKRQIDCLVKVKNRIADGAIIMESTIDDKFLHFLENNNPVVQCSAHNNNPAVPYVTIDNIQGGTLAADLFIGRGHKRIAFIGTDDQARYNRERREGFLKRVAEAGLEQDMALVINADLSFEGGCRAALEFMRLPQPPTALFFVSDMQAIGAVNGLAAAGYKIPADVAVLGFDNIELCNMVIPALTTIAQPMRRMGREAARLLIERIHNNGEVLSQSVVFPPEIVLRGTV